MSLEDRFGAPVSAGRRASVDRLDRAAHLLLGFFADPLAEIDAALAEDPDFVMGHCFRAGLHLISSEKGAAPVLAQELAELERLAPQANERERGHAEAIRAWLEEDFHRASEAYGRVLFDHPRDLIALAFAHQCDFFLGQAGMLRDRVARVLPDWSEADADYGFLLGMYAFGLEECGQYARAEEAGRRAVNLNPGDAWAVHAVAHVLDMEGRADEGVDWLAGSAQHWSPGNMLAYHNWWHLALYRLERNETDEALRLYDSNVRPAPSTVALEMVDAAALLWRLQLRGVDVGNRWAELADLYEAVAEDAYYPFNDMHAMMAFVSTGREAAAERLLAALAAKAGDGTSSARLVRDVGLPAARAFHAFGQGRYGEAFEILTDLRKRAQLFGGSHAQRDVLNLTQLEAARRANMTTAVRALLNERAAEKPSSPWLAAQRAAMPAAPAA